MTIIAAGSSRNDERTPDRPPPGPRVPAVAVVAALAILGAITVGETGPAAPSPDRSPAIPSSVVTSPPAPVGAGRWVETGTATGELLEAVRGPVGYVLPTRDGVVTITDSDEEVRVTLPELHSARGIAAAAPRVVVYGQSLTGPAVWESPDGLAWTLHRLPWQGAARAATFDDIALVVFGIAAGSEGLTGIVARERPGGLWELTPSPVPPSSVTGVPGGFVVRERDPGDDAYHYFTTKDMVVHEPFADRFLITSVGLAAGVIDTARGPRLLAPPLDTTIDPPDWPVVGLWLEGDRIWLQTAQSLWTSLDGRDWEAIPLDRTLWRGLAIALPVGDEARVVVSEGTGLLRIYRWEPGR